MAKSKKPVIAGVGRPAGIIDDVVYPIASKVARKVLQKSIKGSSDRSFDVYKKSRQAMKKIDSRRINSYTDKSNKLYKKELEFGRSVKQITKSANKREVLEAKIMGVPSKGTSFGGPKSRARQVRRNQTARKNK